MATCNGQHSKGDGSWWDSDARGIPTARVCGSCIDQKRKGYRREIFEDLNYEAGEQIEAE